jgi:hypothetical protein
MTDQIVDVFVPRPDGTWVSEAFKILNEVVQDYDSNLIVAELPSELRHTTWLQEHFYCVYDYSVNSAVFWFSPKEPPNKVLARIFRADTRKNDVLKNMEDEQTAQKMLNMRKQIDDEEMRKDLAAWALKTHKNYPHFKPIGEDKIVKFDDQLRRI